MIEPYLDLISDIKPDGFILENVESILHPKATLFNTIIDKIQLMGFIATFKRILLILVSHKKEKGFYNSKIKFKFDDINNIT